MSGIEIRYIFPLGYVRVNRFPTASRKPQQKPFLQTISLNISIFTNNLIFTLLENVIEVDERVTEYADRPRILHLIY